MKLVLPALIAPQTRFSVLALTGLIFLIGYQLPNHIHFFKPKLLPLTGLDLGAPFLPLSFYVYVSEYAFFPICYFLLRKDLNRNRMTWAFWACTLFSSIVFFLHPTTYPRMDFPIPENTDILTNLFFSVFRTIDDPSNTFPSMHVASCFLSSYCFYPKGESKVAFWFTLIWAILVSVSTMTTKQHYFVDILSGFVLATVSYWIFFARTLYVPKNEFIQKYLRKDWDARSAE